MTLYLDTAYVAKCYVNEPDASRVRALVRGRSGLVSSAWCRPELACVMHRHVREGSLTRRQADRLYAIFLQHVSEGIWELMPLSEEVLAAVEAGVRRLHGAVFVRAGDALHLASAALLGLGEIWTSDRHMLAAAPHFGLQGRSV